MIVTDVYARPIAELLGLPPLASEATALDQQALIDYLLGQTVHTVIGAIDTAYGTSCTVGAAQSDVFIEVDRLDPLNRGSTYIRLPIDTPSTAYPSIVGDIADLHAYLGVRLVTPTASAERSATIVDPRTIDPAIQYEIIPSSHLPGFVISASTSLLAYDGLNVPEITYEFFLQQLEALLAAATVQELREAYYTYLEIDTCRYYHDLVLRVPPSGFANFYVDPDENVSYTLKTGSMYHLPFDASDVAMPAVITKDALNAYYKTRSAIIS